MDHVVDHTSACLLHSEATALLFIEIGDDPIYAAAHALRDEREQRRFTRALQARRGEGLDDAKLERLVRNLIQGLWRLESTVICQAMDTRALRLRWCKRTEIA